MEASLWSSYKRWWDSRCIQGGGHGKQTGLPKQDEEKKNILDD